MYLIFILFYFAYQAAFIYICFPIVWKMASFYLGVNVLKNFDAHCITEVIQHTNNDEEIEKH